MMMMMMMMMIIIVIIMIIVVIIMIVIIIIMMMIMILWPSPVPSPLRSETRPDQPDKALPVNKLIMSKFLGERSTSGQK